MCCRRSTHSLLWQSIVGKDLYIKLFGTKQLTKFEQKEYKYCTLPHLVSTLNKYSMTGDVGLTVTIYYLFCSTVGSVGDIASNATTFRRRSFATRAPLIFVWPGSLNGGYRVSHRHDRKVHTLLDSPTTRPCSSLEKKHLCHIGILLFRVNFCVCRERSQQANDWKGEESRELLGVVKSPKSPGWSTQSLPRKLWYHAM